MKHHFVPLFAAATAILAVVLAVGCSTEGDTGKASDTRGHGIQRRCGHATQAIPMR